jgi:hypothetical protein
MYRTPRCIQEGKSTKTEEKLNHINQRNNLKTIVISDVQVPRGGFEGRVINIYINIQ